MGLVKIMVRVLVFLAALLLGPLTISQTIANAQDAKQTVFGGVKLGTRADQLGFKIDEDRAWYEYKNKYYLTGSYDQKGHPIFQIQLNCSNASKNDEVNGISCKNKPDDILKKFGNQISTRCDKDEPSDWADFTRVNIYYNRSTNQYWYIDKESDSIFALGISSEFDNPYYNCFREFSLDEINKIQLKQNAEKVLKDNFYGTSGRTLLNPYTEINYHFAEDSFPIYKIAFLCKSVGEAPKHKLSGFGCGNSGTEIYSALGPALEKKCYPPFNGEQRFAAYYNPKTREYWDANSESEPIYSFGYLDNTENNWSDCLKAKDTAATANFGKPEELWEKISDADSTTIFLDTKTMTRRNGEVRFWTYYKYIDRRCMAYCNNYARAEKVDSAKFYIGINCKEDQYRMLGYEYFQMLSGNRITYESSDVVGEWRSIIKSDDVLLRDKVCG